ncbi:MAG: class D beta-lactamase [Calditrichaeota bacterium]|nr:MAG: class D beta-lactamase [Calditrichota bacterium]MBL1206011.1 class D beta-lactamase [Calditrichota bacterium]NOG45839.1 class D beta-lactamase [Calditrichota bacterium]
MKKVFLLLFVSNLFSIAAERSKAISPDQIAAVFKKYNATGTFALYDLNAGNFTIHNPSRADSAAIPASTFKIFNSLVILEEGVVKDENETFKWDGKKKFLKNWESDHNLSSAIEHSAVWFYQECARRIGEERMQFWIDSVGYGNRNISGGIDRFWLDGGIRITPKQQIELLKKLYLNQLPFSQRSMDIVKEITIRKKKEDYTLHAKTGWAIRFNPQIGWYVGWLEKDDNVFFFAMNIDIRNNEDGKKRRKITFEIFGLD